MHRRGMKQLIYGLFFLVALLLLAWLFYLVFLQPAPTCTDGKKNQDEVEVDCGGSCSECELRRVQAVRVFPALAVSSADGKRSSLMVQLQNPNANYGVSPLVYTVNLYGADGGVIYSNTVETFIYPSEITYRIEPNIPVPNSRISRSEIVINRQDWVRRDLFTAPKSQIRDVQVMYDEAKREAVVTGVFKNDNAFIVPRVVVGIILYGDTGSLAGVSKTLLDGLQPLEERIFSVSVPVTGLSGGVGIAEPKVFIEAKR